MPPTDQQQLCKGTTDMPSNSVEIVENFWREVWQRPHNPDAIHDLVSADFVITSGGRDIVGREISARG